MLLQTTLDAILDERDLEKVTEDQYRRSFKRFKEFLGREPDSSDLTPATVNAWVRHLQSQLSGTSCRNHLRGILVLWNYLAAQGEIEPYNTRRIRRPKEEVKVVVAWTLEDVRTILKCCEQLVGKLRCGIRASEFMAAWIWVAYETGLRPSDMRRISPSNIDFDTSTLSVTQHKTGIPHSAILSSNAINAVRKIIAADRSRVFPLDKTGLRKWEQKVYNLAAKRGFSRRQGSGIGTLRKTHATTVFRDHGLAAAAESLGHVGGVRTARKHYIDTREVSKRPPPRSLKNERSRSSET